ncbi:MULTISPECIES: hypothetical protein [unclassified Spirosoma]|uniref:hypothetical protein n=1 Tax=unclassified Spirosoma TaxID=2621999 RepID=UPI0009698936|nr:MULTISPECIES: hypothetical protein [unclassified Spirosoma]MBN8825950.1 hypothetical protein [Spirosoma sp.]OJW70982.1 MAG: hypothetical protein BGO59_32725 [Spirosoma sp. 48-14]
MTRPYLLIVCVLVSCLAVTCVRDYPSTDPHKAPAVTNPAGGGLPSQTQESSQKRLYLANDKIRMAIDLNAGGAITYLSEAGSNVNMVNNNDLGRQIQTSLYAGPYPYSVNGKNPVEQWRNLGWNPVQTGDYFNHPAQVVSYQQGQNLLYVKTIPLIWPLFNEPADCFFEHWIELKENTVHMRSRMTINRVDTTQYEARTQEFPCVYLNGPYYRIITYDGMKPFTNDAVSEYSEQDNINRYGTENWIALLNTSGRGVGLYKPKGEVRFSSAGFGVTKDGGEFDVSSGYVCSQPALLVDYNGVYEYECDLVVGSLADIRQFAYNQPRPPAAPNYRFVTDRQGWYYGNTRDKGWPIQNELNVRWYRADPTAREFRVISPMAYWKASDVPKIYIQAAFQTKGTVARFVWRKPGDIAIIEMPGRYVDFPIIGDGQFRTYEINMSQLAGWDGVINQISLTSPESQYEFEKGSIARIRSITTTP